MDQVQEVATSHHKRILHNTGKLYITSASQETIASNNEFMNYLSSSPDLDNVEGIWNNIFEF